jgi:hypothetical protein
MLQRCRAVHARSLSFAVLVTALCLDAVPARSQSRDAAADALLAIDLNRATVIDRIVMQWGGLLLPSGSVLDAAQLRTRLSGLRADRLLAASLAGTPQGLQQVLRQAEAATLGKPHLKSLGEAASDLTYTPLTPCRIVDTRNAVGPLQPGVTRTEAGYTATTFAAQGGASSNCGIPAGVAALALNIVAVDPANLGFIKLWPANAAQPNASTLNYDPTTMNIATGTIVRVDAANNNSFDAESPAQVQMVVDVVGYFAAPSGNGGKFFQQGGNAFGTAASLGTSDNQPFAVLVGNQPSLRITSPVSGVVDVINGAAVNAVGAGVIGATIAGGGTPTSGANVASGNFVSIGGGANNQASGEGATVAGGAGNLAANMRSTIGGGDTNAASGLLATIAGGHANVASGDSATVGGGDTNSVAGSFATVSGGLSNTASGSGGTVAGGESNSASGSGAMVAGGSGNTASGAASFAAGVGANANTDGCMLFVFWIGGSGADCFGTVNQFRIMGSHGLSVDYGTPLAGGNGDHWVTISDTIAGKTIAAWNNAYLSNGGTWVNASDRRSKEHFTPIDPQHVLEQVLALPVTTWNYKAEPNVRRVGPVAQDFHAAFGLGADDVTIAPSDEAGVAFAAIKGLYQRLQARDARIDALEHELEEQKRMDDARARELAGLRDALQEVLSRLPEKTRRVDGGLSLDHQRLVERRLEAQ